jgi:glycine cleavage system aminomethyltransferase T
MAQYTLIPNERGGAIDDAYLYRLAEDDLAAPPATCWLSMRQQGERLGLV